MSSDVDICNLALSYIGDTATVSNLNPPEGSVQSQHCARFYPFARDSLLEMHSWGFATKRLKLALLSTYDAEWTYAYAQPNDAVNIIAIIDPSAVDDYSQAAINSAIAPGGSYVPQPFSCEIDATGAPIILTNQALAELRYTALVTDAALFSPLFTVTLAWYLASMLAGPILKGAEGAAESKRCMGMMKEILSNAIESDAGQRRIDIQQKVSWISRR
jgi:hypothetical protein